MKYLFLACLSIFARPALAEMQLDNIKLAFDGTRAAEGEYMQGSGALGFENLTELQGRLIVKEIDRVSFTERETIVPVVMRIRDVGILAKASIIGTLNVILPRGKKISDIFASEEDDYANKFSGLNIGAGVIAVNLDETHVRNSRGVAINDLQGLLFRGAGVQLAYRELMVLRPGSGSARQVVRARAPTAAPVPPVEKSYEEVFDMEWLRLSSMTSDETPELNWRFIFGFALARKNDLNIFLSNEGAKISEEVLSLDRKIKKLHEL